MTEVQKTILFILADESQNAGDRDAMKAMARIIAGHEDPALQYLAYKAADADALITEARAITGDPRRLPTTDAEYANMPLLDDAALTGINGETQVVAVGTRTLDAALHVQEMLRAQGVDPDVHYLSHKIDAVMMKTIVDHQITAITPVTRDILKKLDETLGGAIKLLPIDAVPHTNLDVMDDYIGFMATENGRIVHNMIMSGESYIFAVVNAGVNITGLGWQPYTQDEALAQGYALGAAQPPGTHLVLSHGGPRNLVDEKEYGEMTADAFAEGFRAAQKSKESVVTAVIERYTPDNGYNMVKAGLMLSQQDGCLGFISNSEGHGTMAGAILHANNREILLGMFPYAAQKLDPSGLPLEQIEKYNKLGICTLSVRPEDGRLAIAHHKSETKTPVQQSDAARKIVSSLRLAQETGANTTASAHQRRYRGPQRGR